MAVINNLKNNPNIVKIAELGCYEVYEHKQDLSVTPSTAAAAYYMSKMNFRKRQVLCTLNGNAVKVQAGAMQWSAGNVEMSSNVSGAKDFFGKALKSLATNESVSKPVYKGNGYVMFEPTYKYILLEDVSSWGDGIVLDDGLFLACDLSVKESISSRATLSTALLGGEGLFNLTLSGEGIAVLESPVPREEIVEIVLDNDEVRIDGNMAIAWSKSLDFSIEKSSKSLIGSIVSGEGLVNVFRGKGKVWLTPIVPGTEISAKNSPAEGSKTNSGKSLL